MPTKKKNFKEAGVSAFLSDVPEPATIPTESIIRELRINPVFQALIPALSNEEYAQLEESLLTDGIREPISVWGETIIDGHNRYEIAQKHNLLYTTVSYDFDSEDDVKLWIFKNQIGRRNLPPIERVKLALIMEPIIAEQAKRQQIRKSASSVGQIAAEQTPDSVLLISTKQNSLEDSDGSVLPISTKQISADESADSVLLTPTKQTSINTRKVIADMAGVSQDTVLKVKKILDSGTPETLEKLKSNNITLNKAYQEVRAQERKTTAIATEHSSPYEIDKYSVIYADYPFDFIYTEGKNKPSDSRSPLLSISQLKKLELPAEDHAILLMWSSSPFLEIALQLMNSWGFKYKTNLIWHRQHDSINQWIRGHHEILLIGIKGSRLLPADDTSIHSVYSERQVNPSVKPSYFYEQIERMFPGETYLDLFGHNLHSDLWNVWDVWGNQPQLPESEGE